MDDPNYISILHMMYAISYTHVGKSSLKTLSANVNSLLLSDYITMLILQI